MGKKNSGAGQEVHPSLILHKSHKEVMAAKITSIVNDEDGKRQMIFGESDGGRMELTDEFFNNHKPERGGYIVAYKDGYISYSPSKAFEEGSERMKMSGREIEASALIQAVISGFSFFEAANILHHANLAVKDQENASLMNNKFTAD